MTTVVVVRKAGQIAIAADTLVTFGDTRLAHGYEDNDQDLQGRHDGGPVHRHGRHRGALPGAAQGASARMPREILQAGQHGRGVRHLHQAAPVLKDNFFLKTKEEDSDPYESSQFSVLIANATGIYGVYSLPRGVRVRAILGHRLGPQLRAGRDARGLRQGQDRARGRRGRHRGGLRIRQELGGAGRRVHTIKTERRRT